MLPPYTILKSPKRRTISVTVSQKGITVRAPIAVSEAKIQTFLQEKQNWILKQTDRFQRETELQSEYENYQKTMIFGTIYRLKPYAGTKTVITDDAVLFSQKTKKMNDTMRKFLCALTEEYLRENLYWYQQQTGAKPSQVKLTSAKGKWGSCDSKGLIRLNYHIAMLPSELIEYVVIHELCHLTQLNHSAKFWNYVSQFYPEYKKARKEIKKYSCFLNLYQS